ncbi:MAG TPA: hypothetical protein VHB79_33195 [Polyangiaceae bacterium]|nr:hypothetical protein [Polyangiaceae bacterium]
MFLAGCSADTTGPAGNTAGTTAQGQAGTANSAGNTGTGGTSSTAGTTGASGSASNGGTSATAGSGGGTAAGAGGMSGGSSGGSGGSGGGGSATRSAGCGMDPGGTDSQAMWVKHDIEVPDVDPAFVAKYAVNAGKTYNWTHRNYFMRLPTNYDQNRAYPIVIGGSGCGGSDTVGSEGGYSPLGTGAGETEAIQVSLSYVLSSAANADCGGAVFADGFVNTPEQQYLAAVVKDVQSKNCTDTKKVFLGGYSSGAFEAITLGCANSDILRGYGVQIGGGLRLDHPACKGPVAAMFVVGLQDNDNPIGPLAQPKNNSLGSAPARDELLTRNGCTGSEHKPWDADYPDCEIYTGCPAQYPVVWCAIQSGHLPDAKDPAVGKYRYEGLWKFWSTLP